MHEEKTRENKSAVAQAAYRQFRASCSHRQDVLLSLSSSLVARAGRRHPCRCKPLVAFRLPFGLPLCLSLVDPSLRRSQLRRDGRRPSSEDELQGAQCYLE